MADRGPKKNGTTSELTSVSAMLLGGVLVSFALALGALITALSNPTCVSPTGAPPNIVGVFKAVGTRYALTTNTSTRAEKTSDLTHVFEATSPPDPYLIRVGKLAGTCEPSADGLFCGGGHTMSTEEVSESCTWVPSCTWTLYCIDHADTGLKINVPTEVDRDGNVQKLTFRKIETGPQYLVAGGIPNPEQKAFVSWSHWERVQLQD